MLSIQYHEFAASCASTDAYYRDTIQLKGGVVMVVRVDVQVWSVQAEQLMEEMPGRTASVAKV